MSVRSLTDHQTLRAPSIRVFCERVGDRKPHSARTNRRAFQLIPPK